MWYNTLVSTLGYEEGNVTWNRAYVQILPEIFAAIHDEVYRDAEVINGFANNDVLQGGTAARDANICPEWNDDKSRCLVDVVIEPFITQVGISETISEAYMRHLDRVYVAAAECITPVVGPNGISDGYLPRATNWSSVTGYTNRAYIRFGLSGDSAHIFYFHSGEKKWKTAVFQLGDPKVKEIISDGIRYTTQPANPTTWRPDPTIQFEFLMPLGIVRPVPEC